MIGALSLDRAGGFAPTLTMLAVRYETRADFSDEDLAVLELLLPAAAWGVHCAMRSSDDWIKDVIRTAFALPPKLTEVALFLAKGMSNAEITAALGLTIGTMKQYVHQVLEAAGASSRTDLCRMILS